MTVTFLQPWPEEDLLTHRKSSLYSMMESPIWMQSTPPCRKVCLRRIGPNPFYKKLILKISKDILKYPDRGSLPRSPADRADRIGPRSGWVWDSLGRSTAIKTKLCHNSGSRRNDFIKLSPHSKPLLPPSCSPSPCSSPTWPPDPVDRSSEPIWEKNMKKIY